MPYSKKQHTVRYILIKIFLIFCLFNFIGNAVSAFEPEIIEISLEPVDPKPMSKINFTAVITSNDSIESVRIIVTECMKEMCSAFGYNESLNKTDEDTFKGQVILTRNNATQIKYCLEILSKGTWYFFDTRFYNLNTTTGFNYETGSSKDRSTPGFELILIFFTIILILFLKKRKL